MVEMLIENNAVVVVLFSLFSSMQQMILTWSVELISWLWKVTNGTSMRQSSQYGQLLITATGKVKRVDMVVVCWVVFPEYTDKNFYHTQVIWWRNLEDWEEKF